MALPRLMALALAALLALLMMPLLLASACGAGERYTPPSTACPGLLCTAGASNGAGGLYSIGAPTREQYDVNGDGYCGECTIQVLMLKHGVWAPQEFVRIEATGSAKGDILPDTSYDDVMRALRIKGTPFKGDGYQEMIAWAKGWLVKGVGVTVVNLFKEAEPDGTYDHIIPAVGIRTKTPNAGYDPNDVLIMHTHFDKKAPEKRVSSWKCPNNKRGSWPGSMGLSQGGCGPPNKWRNRAWAIQGPVYAGIGPPVELQVSSWKEPGVRKSVSFSGTVIVRGLTSGKSYKLYQINNPKQVPASPSAKPSGSPWKTFTATGAEMKFPVTFPSRTAQYFIAVEA